MSSDVAFWKTGTGDPEELFDGLAEGETDALHAHPDVAAFRADLLARWPGLVDVLEPGDHDLRDAPADAAKYVLLTLGARQLQHLDAIYELARRYDLRGYSGVGEAAF